MNTEPEGSLSWEYSWGERQEDPPYLLGALRCQMPHILYLTSSTVILSVFFTTESPGPSRVPGLPGAPQDEAGLTRKFDGDYHFHVRILLLLESPTELPLSQFSHTLSLCN